MRKALEVLNPAVTTHPRVNQKIRERVCLAKQKLEVWRDLLSKKKWYYWPGNCHIGDGQLKMVSAKKCQPWNVTGHWQLIYVGKYINCKFVFILRALYFQSYILKTFIGCLASLFSWLWHLKTGRFAGNVYMLIVAK